MRILHIIDSLGVGGAERLLVSVINGLTSDTNFVISLSDHTPLAGELPGDTKLVTLGLKSKLDVPRCIKQVRAFIREQKIDVVHSHLVMGNIIARFACPARVPLFNSLHNLNANRVFARGQRWQRWLEKFSYRKRHHIIAVSKSVLDEYKSIIGLKGEATVLYNFVDDRFFAEAPHTWNDRSRLRMVAVGSFKAQKNYGYLVQACQQLPPNVTLDIYGTGAEWETIQRLIVSTGARIELKGNHDSIHTVLPQYDLFVMSSLFEGHPVALLEAMAAGMPAILSDIPVLREVTGNHGIHFDISDTTDFGKRVDDILAGRVALDANAQYNWRFAQSIGRKDQYLAQLRGLYQQKIDSATSPNFNTST